LGRRFLSSSITTHSCLSEMFTQTSDTERTAGGLSVIV
jgi:hypothetical protein